LKPSILWQIVGMVIGAIVAIYYAWYLFNHAVTANAQIGSLILYMIGLLTFMWNLRLLWKARNK